MIEIPSLRPESRYGIPAADQLLFNREYIVGYSYLFRQPRWAMEVIDPDNRRVEVDRIDSFRPDMRVPEKFRAGLDDYRGSGHDRGHLVASADRRAAEVLNSETFLLTNMSPQIPEFNRGIWKKLEMAVRELAFMYVEVYVICGPLFDVGKEIKIIGQSETQSENDVIVPIPHSFFKSILAEDRRGSLKLWSFVLPNEKSDESLDSFLRTTTEIEMRAGIQLWDRLLGESADKLKSKKGRMWSLTEANRIAKQKTTERAR